MTDLPDCRYAQQQLWQDAQGDWWETFEISDLAAGQGRGVRFDNEIIRPAAATQTPAGEVLASRNLCSYPPTAATPSMAVTASVPTAPDLNSGDGAVGLLLVLGIAGSAVWAWFNKGKDDYADAYHPMADVPALPPVYLEPVRDDSLGNEPLETPRELATEFTEHSIAFDRSSEAITPELGPDPLSQAWPPKSMGAPYNPLQPEQEGEFDAYRRSLDKDGLNPKGNDILKTIWGVTPGRSAAYQAARKRRDDFAKRLDYYRYEEM